MNGTVWFVGAGPGDPDLITVKGRQLISQADAILYAGSLVDAAALQYASAHCQRQDSKTMTLDQITAWLMNAARQYKTVVRLQTGDPSLYGALIEMTRPLTAAGIHWQVVPGVTSACAAAAVAQESLTLPAVTQTVILTRIAGQTPMPTREQLAQLAAHQTSLCIYLAATQLDAVANALLAAGWAATAPVVVVHKATWLTQQIVRGCIQDIAEKTRAAGIENQAMVIASPTLGAGNWPEITPSKLYDAEFTHQFRSSLVCGDE
ncbi:precorrin-4 C(11)-methyltransferase [Rhodoferax sp. 4810]|uniref:Precorrin-4 C(11)-methyltransferase n=1 Tax=Thiospirillum jenense TaxID=1653858 RepID=A0A839HID3_9GAMM|nr:precorrin-4 C(11)-methyltransferase [Thiospirillum jenense]MBB1075457.1 precorrin-4 C(11)-methyltransferase [Rhodoferax jenense]MBB1126836.1 precorrin-4 C(11)-methyltransferase [Thiospirillum jenense]